jgi:lauroyl/myristoyl acyltransferase
VALYWGVRLATLLTRIIPLRVSYAAARFAGLVMFYAWPGGRRRCIANMMRVADGDADLAKRYARRSFGNYGVYLIDFLRFPGTTAGEVRERVVYDDWPLLEEQRSGNGIVFVTVHFGVWDMGAAALAVADYPITTIADVVGNDRVNEFVVGSRRHLGMSIVEVGRAGPGLLRALKRNDVVAALVDIPDEDGVEVTFFGGTVRVPDGIARIALRAGSSVVVATLWRASAWRDEIGADVVPVPFEPSGDTEADAQALTQAIFTRLEDLVRRDPSQWYIFRHLWPADAAPVPAATR